MPYGRGRGGGGGGSPWQPRDGPPGRPMGSGKGGGFKGAGGGRGGAGGGRGGGAGLEGSLNARLSAARSCDDMLLLHAQMQSSMDIRHLGLLWPKLGKRVALECGKGRAAVKQWTRAHAAGLDALIAQTGARAPPRLRARRRPRPASARARAPLPPSPRPPAARARRRSGAPQ